MVELSSANIGSRRSNSAGVQTAWTARKGGSSGPFGGHATLGDVAAYFSFEEDASDSTENKATGSLLNAPDIIAGFHNNCVDFKDATVTDAYRWNPEMTFTGGDDGELSASMWLYIPSTRPYSGGRYLISSSDDSHHNLGFDGNKPMVNMWETHSDAIPTDGWHHLVVCWPGANVTVGGYMVIDNDWAGRKTFNNQTGLSISHIGSTYWQVKTDAYNGYLDELGFWNRKLTESEISDLYNSGSGLFYDS